MGDIIDTSEDLVQLARLAINEQTEDVRLFVARFVRNYRGIKPDLAEQMDHYVSVPFLWLCDKMSYN